jgi:hypothetical protein
MIPRIRWYAGALVLIALVVAGCGDDDGDVALITRAEAPAIADRDLLTAADLGEGWVDAPAEAVSNERTEDSIEFDRCLLGDDYEAAVLARFEPRAFVPEGAPVVPDDQAADPMASLADIMSRLKVVAYATAVVDTGGSTRCSMPSTRTRRSGASSRRGTSETVAPSPHSKAMSSRRSGPRTSMNASR